MPHRSKLVGNQPANKVLSRRGALLTSLGILWSAACKTRTIHKPAGIKTDTRSRVIQDDDNNQETICGKANNLDLGSLNPSPERFTTSRIVYGSPTCALIAIKMTFSYKGDLDNIFLVGDDGMILAQRRISSNTDIINKTELKPIIFDNINYSHKKNFHIVWQSDKIYYLSRFSTPPTVQNKFLDVDVIQISTTSIPQNIFAHQIPPNSWFIPKNLDGSVVEATGSYTPTDFTTYCPNSALSGFYICDIMGNILNRYGDQFIDPTNYDFFICYILGENKKYLRYIVHLV